MEERDRWELFWNTGLPAAWLLCRWGDCKQEAPREPGGESIHAPDHNSPGPSGGGLQGIG